MFMESYFTSRWYITFTALVLSNNIKRAIKISLGSILFAWLAYSLHHQVKSQDRLEESLHSLLQEWTAAKITGIVVVFLLMIVNWSIESKKWQMLLKHTEQLSFIKSFQSVLMGLAISIITPNRIGEYLGRILYLKNTNKLKGISITIIGSFAQMLVTSMFGVLGLLFYLYSVEQSTWLYGLLALSFIMACIMFYMLFHLEQLVDFCQRIPLLKKVSVYIEVIKRYERATLIKLILFAAARYLVYSTQFFLLLYITHQYFLPLQTFAGIWMLFWIIAIVPSFVIADLGIRGQSAITVLAFVSGNELAILVTSVLLWFINLILPSLVGCLFVFKIRMFDND